MMAEPLEIQHSKAPRPAGPFVTAALSTVLSSGLIGVMYGGLKLTLKSVAFGVIPVMTVATMLVAVSMGWIFISIGRSKLQPRWVAGTAVLITITMLELLVATYLTEG
jgi:hypothetical protein